MEIEAKGARFGRESEARAGGNRRRIRMPIMLPRKGDARPRNAGKRGKLGRKSIISMEIRGIYGGI